MPITAAATATIVRNGSISRVSRMVSSSLPGTRLKSAAYAVTSGRGEDDAGGDERGGDDEQRVEQVVAQTPRVVFAVEREPARERRHERGAHGAFREQVANEVRDAERHDEGVHVVAGAEDGGEHLIAQQAENAAGECGGAGQAGGTRKQRRTRRRQAPSLRRTSSLTVLPSTFCPASLRHRRFHDAAHVFGGGRAGLGDRVGDGGVDGRGIGSRGQVRFEDENFSRFLVDEILTAALGELFDRVLPLLDERVTT